MIYIYNSDNKFEKQIDYVVINIFYLLGLKYNTIEYNQYDNVKSDDILLLYTDDNSLKFVDNFKNIIIIEPSRKLFCENYLKMGSVPHSIKKFKAEKDKINNEDIISIFDDGTDLYINKTFGDKRIIKTNMDIISDIFFMLTRYEEVVNKKAYENERFNRFPASESLAFKNGFLDRPIVNEHIDLLWSFIDSFQLGYKRKSWWGNKNFAACLTHDVDSVQKYKRFKNIIRPSASLLIRQKKPLKAIKNFFDYFKGYKGDPYNTFDYIMNLEKSYGFRSSFYFMSGGNSEFDNSYDVYDMKVKQLIDKIENEDFEAGYHCSYNSYNDFNMMSKEKEKLNELISKKPYGCRQHFLRFQIPYTWEIQEQINLLYDTTLSFADAEGFRCGTCFPFKPYDLLENRILNIWEIPLIIMEGSLQNPNYRAYTPQKGLEETKKLIDTVKKHKGVFTMLYHNSSFDPFNTMWDGWKDTYESTMKYLFDNDCLGTSGREIIDIIIK